jgi:hypothetical protein
MASSGLMDDRDYETGRQVGPALFFLRGSDQLIALSPSVPAKVIGEENWKYRMTAGNC